MKVKSEMHNFKIIFELLFLEFVFHLLVHKSEILTFELKAGIRWVFKVYVLGRSVKCVLCAGRLR